MHFVHGRRLQRAGRGRSPPWNFIHGTDILDRSGLSVLFFVFFPLPPPWKRLNSAIFRYFSDVPPGHISAYAFNFAEYKRIPRLHMQI